MFKNTPPLHDGRYKSNYCFITNTPQLYSNYLFITLVWIYSLTDIGMCLNWPRYHVNVSKRVRKPKLEMTKSAAKQWTLYFCSWHFRKRVLCWPSVSRNSVDRTKIYERVWKSEPVYSASGASHSGLKPIFWRLKVLLPKSRKFFITVFCEGIKNTRCLTKDISYIATVPHLGGTSIYFKSNVWYRWIVYVMTRISYASWNFFVIFVVKTKIV